MTPNDELIQSSNIDLTNNYNDDHQDLTPIYTEDYDPTVNSMTLQDLNELLHITNTNMKTFTHNDLKTYIQDYWKLTIQINPDIRSSDSQMDGGANTNVTNNKRLIKHYRSIQTIPITGVGGDGPACLIKGEGYMDLQTNEGDWMTIKVYYAPRCNGTIVSPNAIVEENPKFTSWTQHSHLDTGKSTIYFYHKEQYHRRKSISMGMKNKLWYIQQPLIPTIRRAHPDDRKYRTIIHNAIAQHINQHAEYELWHQRLLHPGQKVMTHLSSCTDGVPNIKKPPFHVCDTCLETKGTKTKTHKSTDMAATKFGQQFHMDFGFVHGRKNNRLIRSHDGFDSYLLITDAKTRYLWIFLCKNKNPPIKTLQLFLDQYGLQTGPRTIRTDQGGELAKSHKIQETIAAAGYSLETTGSDNSSQNGMIERPHRTLANMMRSALTDSGMDQKYWSDALVHSVFIKNRLPHAAFNYTSTPYTEVTGTKPNIESLRIFGSPITTRKPGRRPVKLDNHCYNGIFLRFAKTLKNIVYLDRTTKKIKTTTYASFDEAHYSSNHKPKGAQRLLHTGMPTKDDHCSSQQTSPHIKMMTNDNSPHTEYLYIKLHDKDAIIPRFATSGSAGYDLHTVEAGIIPPSGTVGFDTGIAIKPPINTYGRIASRSGLAMKHNIETKAGVIDADYTGTVRIILHNFGCTSYTVRKGDRIAQLVLEQHKTPPTKCIQELESTDRGEQGFASTGFSRHINSTSIQNNTDLDLPDIDITPDAPEYTVNIKIPSRGSHNTLGLITTRTSKGMELIDCLKSTPSAKIPRWKQTLKGSILKSINGTSINSTESIVASIKLAKKQRQPVICQFATKEPINIHPDTGIPQLHFDQIGVLSHLLQDIIYDETPIIPIEEAPPLDNAVQISKMARDNLTRTKLMKRDDWSDWQESEYLQLDQYKTQDMFSEPTELPNNDPNINILPMIWTYLIKSCGRKKARCVANGAPHLKGSITLANTYAACLDQTGARIFWAIAALTNKIVYGSDASNAFAEAPAPKAPLYLRIDQAYKDWYKARYQRDIPPHQSYVRVKHAIQGHPESPRLWQDFIDNILKDLGFSQVTHEPCLYTKIDDATNERIYLLRQVDDFAVACSNKTIADQLWDSIDNRLSAKLKREGILTRHNGIDITQTASYIKIHCSTYLDKIITPKLHLLGHNARTNKPTPMKADPKYQQDLDSEKGPTLPKEQAEHYQRNRQNSKNKWDLNIALQQESLFLLWLHVARILVMLSLN